MLHKTHADSWVFWHCCCRLCCKVYMKYDCCFPLRAHMMKLVNPFLYNKAQSLASFDDISRLVISYDLIYLSIRGGILSLVFRFIASLCRVCLYKYNSRYLEYWTTDSILSSDHARVELMFQLHLPYSSLHDPKRGREIDASGILSQAELKCYQLNTPQRIHCTR